MLDLGDFGRCVNCDQEVGGSRRLAVLQEKSGRVFVLCEECANRMWAGGTPPEPSAEDRKRHYKEWLERFIPR
jgi:hypothetical protein